MDGTDPPRPDRGSPDVGPGDEPREIPAAPFVPNRPWRIVFAAGVVCLVALLVLVSIAKDRASEVPPLWLFAASGIVVAGIGGYAVWLAASQVRLVSRSAIALGAGFACIAVAKFALAPFGFFDQTRSRTIELIVSQQMLIVVAGLGVPRAVCDRDPRDPSGGAEPSDRRTEGTDSGSGRHALGTGGHRGGASFLDAALHPERVRIGYKA